MHDVDVVVTTVCAQSEPFLSCRKSLEKTLPKGVTPFILIDRDKEGAAPMVDRILRGAATSGRDTIYLHNDMKCISETWYQDLCTYAKKFPRAGILTVKRIFLNGIIQEAGGAQLMFDGSSQPVGRGAMDYGQFDDPREIPFISWGGNYIRAQAVQEVGFLDPQFLPAYYEDLDYSLQCRKAGWKLMYVPVTIQHLESFTSNETHGSKIADLSRANAQKFLKKWDIKPVDASQIPQWY